MRPRTPWASMPQPISSGATAAAGRAKSSGTRTPPRPSRRSEVGLAAMLRVARGAVAVVGALAAERLGDVGREQRGLARQALAGRRRRARAVGGFPRERIVVIAAAGGLERELEAALA